MVFSQLQTRTEAPPPILPTPWLESQALFLLELMLQQSRTQYELGKLLQVFADTDVVLPHGKANLYFYFAFVAFGCVHFINEFLLGVLV